MRLNLVHSGIVVGSVDLRPEIADGAEASAGLLMGRLEPTPAYEAIRPALQALAPAPLGTGEPLTAPGAIALRRERLAALGLELRTAAGASVTLRFLDVTDSTAELADLPHEVRAVAARHLAIVVAAELAGRRHRRANRPAAT